MCGVPYGSPCSYPVLALRRHHNMMGLALLEKTPYGPNLHPNPHSTPPPRRGPARTELRPGSPAAPLDHLAVHLRLPLTSLLDLVGLSPRTYNLYRRQGRPITLEVSARLSHLTRVTEAAEAYFHECLPRTSGSSPPRHLRPPHLPRVRPPARWG